MTRRFLSLLLASALAVGTTGCDSLEQNPVATSSKDAVFGSENGLALYTNSLDNWMPDANNIIQAESMSDYAARRDVPQFVRPGVYNPRVTDLTSSGQYEVVALGGDVNWRWNTLRSINYFLANNVDASVPERVRNNYNGIARFFRAWFYFEKVKRYGDVPWIDKPLDVSDPALYGPRDSRTVVMDHVLEDLDFAIANITAQNEASRTLITKDVALALKSRVALFEGTFRKYHPEFNLQSSADKFLNESANAAKVLIDGKRYSLYTGSGVTDSYRQVFTRDVPIAQEVILTNLQSTSLGVRHQANWIYTSATTGVRFSFIRQFINTYLNADGTPFTDRAGYQTMTFQQETKGRDARLSQTIRTPGYKRVQSGTQVAAPPAFTYTYTGYHPIKFSTDDASQDGGQLNTNAVHIFRYAEVLLNYAEAKAELGQLTAADWAATVGATRARAGITGGLTSLPTTVDPYLKSVYFPDISNPVILEIRRERGIELAMEGLRFYDIVRWARGPLMEMEWRGIYVPAANTNLDLDENGTPDVNFFTVNPTNRVNGVTYISVTGSDFKLANGTSGEIVWRNDIPRKWDQKLYLYPIPESDLLTNPALKQNPGW
ncbi:RagB/SusD domain-containing protein [Gemmatirosa kalamazoonensis]|uniref:RagB/SusD domain-containing protein n=1 Tax=Gemmatirosa kalamazoonensis TaxID=861299 RepID=W0RLN3_9BACT|nr:RagB/SusD family nutrient uptake outer membrane protein [Gemmatirosa kalamazoonensis]AHG91215.1 RagB/SusD domain-containing protein [Gemmatirosa kalamazoonensis]